MDHQIPARRPNQFLIDQEKKILSIFAVPKDHKVKIKYSKKILKYLDLTKEQKKQCYMIVTVIAIMIGVLGTVIKSF